MKTDIIIAGVGGQGILSIAAVIGHAALKNNLQVKQSETHGMSQRGGDVVSHLRLSDSEIYSDLIPRQSAKIIIAMEPMEALRYLPWLQKGGYIITHSDPVKNIPNYPDENKILNRLKMNSHLVIINPDKIANDAGSKTSSNMMILGAAARYLDILSFDALCSGVEELFKRKGNEVVAKNIDALKTGYYMVTHPKLN